MASASGMTSRQNLIEDASGLADLVVAPEVCRSAQDTRVAEVHHGIKLHPSTSFFISFVSILVEQCQGFSLEKPNHSQRAVEAAADRSLGAPHPDGSA